MVVNTIKMLDRQFSNPTQIQPQQPNGVSTVSVAVATSGNNTPLPVYRDMQDKKTLEGSGKKIEIYDNMSIMDRIILCASELLGTGILVFLGCSGCVSGLYGSNFVIPHLQICFSFAFAITTAVQCVGHISGAHINPSVTVAAAVMGVIPLVQIPLYICGQLLGSLVGFGLLYAVTPREFLILYKNESGQSVRDVGVCSPSLNPLITTFQGVLMEFVGTFILIVAVCSVWDTRNSKQIDSTSIRLGIIVGAIALSAGPYTGANLNPARSFAPALINGDWDNHWVYWVGPLLAGLCGGAMYKFIFNRDEKVLQVSSETLVVNGNHND